MSGYGVRPRIWAECDRSDGSDTAVLDEHTAHHRAAGLSAPRPAPKRTNGPRMNGAIRASKVRLVTDDGAEILDTKAALERARSAGLDLVEVAPGAEPPVCKIVSYSKWRYEQDQKEKDRRRGQVDVKEMKFNVRIGAGDVAVKCRKIVEMLENGDRVKLVVQMRGRESTHPELAAALLDRVIEAAAGAGRVEGRSGRDGNRFNALLVPKKPAS